MSKMPYSITVPSTTVENLTYTSGAGINFMAGSPTTPGNSGSASSQMNFTFTENIEAA